MTLNFGDLLESVAQVVPERQAIIYADKRYTWAEFDTQANRLARNLIELGLMPNSKVAFYLRNSPAYVVLLAACFKARLVHVNVNYRYVDQELHYVIDNADAELVVFDQEFAGQIDQLAPRLPKVKAFLAVGPAEDSVRALSFERLCLQGEGAPVTLARSGDDLYFMYTGGTTGYPKAVMWPHKSRIAVIGMAAAETAAAHARAVAGSARFPVTLPVCPMMHSTGFTTVLSALCAGGCVVLMPGSRFDAHACLAAIGAHKVTTVVLVGDAFSVPMIEALVESADRYDLSSVTTLSSAGAMWSAKSKAQLLKYFYNAIARDSLGSSEGSRLAGSEMRAGESGQTGRFKLGPDVKVFTEDHLEVQPGSGQAGLLATSGPIPLGYYKDDKRTAETFPIINGVRYSMPGDWCTLESDGTINLLGRGSHCINTGGEKVYPEEVEEALKSHARVLDCAVFGVADERWGHAVNAVVQLRAPAEVSESDLYDHLRGQLAAYKRPKTIVCVQDSFRTENGKMDYNQAKYLFNVNLRQAD